MKLNEPSATELLDEALRFLRNTHTTQEAEKGRLLLAIERFQRQQSDREQLVHALDALLAGQTLQQATGQPPVTE